MQLLMVSRFGAPVLHHHGMLADIPGTNLHRSDRLRRNALPCRAYIQLLDQAAAAELADRQTCKVAGG